MPNPHGAEQKYRYLPVVVNVVVKVTIVSGGSGTLTFVPVTMNVCETANLTG